jgi:hypothetical protein
MSEEERKRAEREEARRHADRSLLVLLVMIALAGIGWLVVDKLYEMKKIQDCVMSGRRNCAPLGEEYSR